ncbi:MAG: bifunctional folylpolyglutamate synthase/dihydrofolate synthase [Chitinophagaceae bacterium]|nr:bifunctional folylpolyglutamate synthase/dihydrofolate synthase [Chitinophagaceae bacterium]
MFTRIGAAAYKADLINTIILCAALDNPQNKFKSIHVAGTNGKGSTSHMLASVLQEAGYKVGLYTSPHIKDFRERIKINGQKIEEQFVVHFTENIKTKITEIQPSFFEITVAMAFAYFAKQQVDIAVIEVGLGGLLDSTNVIIPELCVITNIGLDHTNLLGTTLPEIATQKAGIIKASVPVVISQTQEETERVFTNKALEKNTSIFFADKVMEVIGMVSTSIGLQKMKVVNTAKMSITTYELDILGKYQQKNVKGVLLALEILQQYNWNISAQNIVDGLKNIKNNTGLMGRFDMLETSPMLIADVAHNADGITEVLAQIKNIQHNNLHIITGFVADKAVDKVLNLFPKNANYYYTQANIPRALLKENLQETAKQYQLNGEAYNNVNTALQAAKANASKEDIILICGSFFIIAELEQYYNN